MRTRRDEHSGHWRPPTGRWRPADGRAMRAALAASGQSPSAFARAVGIGLHRVNYWRMKLDDGRAPEAGAGGGFVAVEVRDDAPGRDGLPDRRVEVTLANGRRVAFAGSWEAAAIAPWLRALEGDRCSG